MRTPSIRTAGRVLALLGALTLCGWGIWQSARAGTSRLISDYGVRTGQLLPADLAVRLTPADPEAHYARAGVLADAGALDEARAAYERAISLRPADYVLWLELGKLREQSGDVDGALAAFGEAVRLAPYYAEPRWQLGNTLLRAGRTADALAELRQAAMREPSRYPSLLNLAWYTAKQEPQTFVELINPTTTRAHLLVARFLAAHDAAQLAVAQFRAADADNTETEQRDLLKELLGTRHYAEAYTVWAAGHADAPAPGQLSNGGFEQPIQLDDIGFGWQLAHELGEAVKLSLDTTAPRAGARSLRLDLAGNAAPDAELAAQLVLASAGTRYRLRFAARTEELVTGGPVFVRVTVANAQKDVALANSALLPTGTSDWHDYVIEFTAPADARALRVAVTRQSCVGGSNPCPVFGRLWLDEFKLEQY
ncbi:MAG: tetratricopeptide repeat protein [Pyrinomonadaceae bacterium]